MLLPADSCIYMHQPTRKHQLCQAAYRPSVCCGAPHLTGSHLSWFILYFCLGGFIEHEGFFYDISPGPELLEFPNSSCYCSSRKNAELLLLGWALRDNAFLWERSGPVPRWEPYKVLCKYHGVLSQWFHRSSQLWHLDRAPQQVMELIIAFH
uniref:Uncharacterized protein n=1 Tax=Pipistrellus kuhlii TaxID=59472 RepID=A0A7J8A7S2_PIPKU|nr:hypothetical protein mPipKuh1_008973 [Pipistrellus kuhlii]